jgi:methyl-accepting chemotaxis protein
MQKILPKSYFNSFVLKSTLLFAGAALLTAAVFYLASQERGSTYAESYKLIAELNRVLVTKSLILFSFTLLLSIAGIIIISIAYSHRVAGPLYKLGIHARKISSGDLATSVRLRTNDVLHVLADDLNGLTGRYRDLLLQVETKTRELAALMDNPGKQTPPADEISKRIDEIKKVLNQIRL